MKTPGERGRIGAWAYEARAGADMSVRQVVDALAAKGHAITESTIRGIEGGSKTPGRRLLRLLGEVLESHPPGEPEPTEEPSLAAAVTLLVEELRAMRLERQELVARVEALEGVVRLLDPPSDATTPTPAVPPATTG